MEVQEKRKMKKSAPLLSEETINGTWKLSYRTTNRLGAAGFTGRFLSSYPDAITGEDRHLEDVNGKWVSGYFIEKIITMFNPSKNKHDRKVVDWLVGHPLVGIEVKQTKLSQQYLDGKEVNPRMVLLNMDYEEVENLEEEDEIDKLIGIISLDKGVQSIGLKKLRWILAALNMNYRDAKYITKPELEKQKLRKALKTYVRSNIESARKVKLMLENLDHAQFKFELKEMISVGVLAISNGMYLYLGNPLGTSEESVKEYFNNNPELYTELTKKLYDALK